MVYYKEDDLTFFIKTKDGKGKDGLTFLIKKGKLYKKCILNRNWPGAPRSPGPPPKKNI